MVAFEDDANVLAFGVSLGILVVFDVAGLRGIDGMITAHGAVIAREPVGASLAEDDVAGDHVLFC